MFQDIENNRKKFASHPILRVIAGEEDRLPDISTDIPSTEWIEEYQVPKTTFQVLDADESQQVAIEAVKRGTNLVIQGPPGTGKSQTITNIIAESLAQGKKVLFVSEKMAALEVVARRLEEVKLREFCLPMHNRDVNRREIVDELNRALFSEDEISVGHLEGLHSQLYETGCIT
jgi:predicted ATP-dependent serine protease